MQTQPLDDISTAFISGAHAQVWCSVATVDAQDRLRSRVLHPIWEGADGAQGIIGWVATGRQSAKAKHIAHNPHLSLCYMKDPLKPLYADCTAAWVEDMDEKRRIWHMLKNLPQPLGYDPGTFFGTVENAAYGLLKLTPWRIELADLFGENRVWRAM